jgi:hypothetical protein
MCAWLERNANKIQAVGAIATTVGMGFAVVALWLTQGQIEIARKSIEATTVYSLQSDARELLSDLQSNPEVAEYLGAFEADKDYPPETVKRAQAKLRVLFQFYSAVFNQHQQGALDDEYWNVFAEEICEFVRIEPVKAYWKSRAEPSKFNQAFKDFLSQCVDAPVSAPDDGPPNESKDPK